MSDEAEIREWLAKEIPQHLERLWWRQRWERLTRGSGYIGKPPLGWKILSQH